MPDWILTLQDTFQHADTTAGGAKTNTGVPTSPDPGTANDWYDFAGGAYSIKDDRLQSANAPGFQGNGWLYRGNDSATLNQRITYETASTTTNDTWYALTRLVPNANGGYSAYVLFAGFGGANIQVWRFIGGTYNSIVGSLTPNAGVAYDPTHQYQVDFGVVDAGTSPASCSLEVALNDLTSGQVYAAGTFTDSNAALQVPGVIGLGAGNGLGTTFISAVQGYTAGFAPGLGTFQGSTASQLVVGFTPPSGPTGAYTLASYGGTTSDFTPGPTNLIAGQATETVTWAPPNPVLGGNYWIKQVATDSTGAKVTTAAVTCVLAYPPLKPTQIGDSITAEFLNAASLTSAWDGFIGRVGATNPTSARPIQVANFGAVGSSTQAWVGWIADPTQTIAGGLTSFCWDDIIAQIIASDADVIPLMLGANDARAPYHTPPAQYTANLKTIGGAIYSATGKKILVNTPSTVQSGAANGQWDDSSPGLIQQYQAAARAAVDNVKIFLGDTNNYLLSVLNPSWFGDGVHPADPGTNQFLALNHAIGLANFLGLASYGPGIYPSPADVLATAPSYGPIGAPVVGSYTPPTSSPATYTAAANVRYGTDRGDGIAGTAHIPAASQVLAGVPVDAGVGNVVLPPAGDVAVGTNFGANGSTPGAMVVPSAGSGGATLDEIAALLGEVTVNANVVSTNGVLASNVSAVFFTGGQ